MSNFNLIMILKSGRVSLEVLADKCLEKKLKKTFSEYESKQIFADEKKFKLEFKTIQKDCFLPEKLDECREILLDYRENYFKQLGIFLDDVMLPDIFLNMLHFEDYRKNILKNRERLKRDFLINEIGENFLLVFDLKNKEGKVYCEDYRAIAVKPKDFKSCLNRVVFYLFAATKSFVLHASAVLLNEKGYLFVGRGGAGKSTIARMILEKFKTARVVSDDMVVISRTGNEYWASKIREIPENKLRVDELNCKIINRIKIDSVYFIEQSKNIKLEEIDSLECLEELVEYHILNKTLTYNFVNDLPLMLLRFIRKFKPEKLHFRKDLDFLRIIQI